MKYFSIWFTVLLLVLNPHNFTFAQKGNKYINSDNAETVKINEILASNTTVLPDEDFGELVEVLIQYNGEMLLNKDFSKRAHQINDKKINKKLTKSVEKNEQKLPSGFVNAIKNAS